MSWRDNLTIVEKEKVNQLETELEENCIPVNDLELKYIFKGRETYD